MTRILFALAAALLIAAGPAAASTVTGNVTHLSSSTPHLDLTDTSWAPFDVAQGVPTASKSFTVLFIADDGGTDPFPLNPTTASVTLRPSTAGAALTCSFLASAPVLTSSNAGTCNFRITPDGASVQIYYLGLLAKGEHVRYTISGLKPNAVGAPPNVIQPFDSDAVIAGQSPSPTQGRLSAKLVLVFDKSGSMDWSAKPADASCGSLYSPTPACRRFNILTAAASQLKNVAKAYSIPGDQLGVVFFDSTAHNTGGVAAMTPTTLDAIGAALGQAANQPGGSTSIGAGVINLRDKIVENNTTFNNMTLLFTDGEQNTAPYLVSDGSATPDVSHLLINDTQNQPFGTPWLATGNRSGLCVFRLRPDDPAGPGGTTTLQQIANQGCNGLMNSSATLSALEPELIQYFLQVLDATLIGDKLELLKDIEGAQPAGASTPATMTFKTSKKDLAFTMLLRWDAGFQMEGRPTLTLTKDGVDFTPLQDPAFQVDGANGHLSMTLRTPFCNAARKCVKPDGDWTLKAQPSSVIGINASAQAANGHYDLFVIADNATIASSFSATQSTPGIGQPLTLTAKLTEGGSPLAGLAAGSVRAFISAPAASLGNILSASAARPAASAASDAISGAGLKALAMLADPAERTKLLDALALGAEQGIPLVETSPGTYSAPFPATTAEGIYRVSFRIAGNSSNNGDFTRLFNTDYYVPVVTDTDATNRTLVITRLPTCAFAGGCFKLVIRPVDAKGNLVGPGKGAIIYAPPFNGQMSAPTVDNLDGTYVVTLGYNDASAGAPVLQIGGVPVTLPPEAGPAGSGGGAGQIIAKWWWLILLLIILLLLLILALRKKGP